MSWYVHHVNLQAHDVRQAAAFFRDVVGLEEGTWTYPEVTGKVGHNPDTIAYFGTLNRGLHIVRAITRFAVDNGFVHNPTIGGHFAICVPDVLAVKRRLETAGVVVSDAGVYAMAGMHQQAVGIMHLGPVVGEPPALVLAEHEHAGQRRDAELGDIAAGIDAGRHIDLGRRARPQHEAVGAGGALAVQQRVERHRRSRPRL